MVPVQHLLRHKVSLSILFYVNTTWVNVNGTLLIQSFFSMHTTCIDLMHLSHTLTLVSKPDETAWFHIKKTIGSISYTYDYFLEHKTRTIRGIQS